MMGSGCALTCYSTVLEGGDLCAVCFPHTAIRTQMSVWQWWSECGDKLWSGERGWTSVEEEFTVHLQEKGGVQRRGLGWCQVHPTAKQVVLAADCTTQLKILSIGIAAQP